MKRKTINLGIVGILFFVFASLFVQPYAVSAISGPVSPTAPVGCQAAGNCDGQGSEAAQKYCGNSDTVDSSEFRACTKGYDGAAADRTKEQACKDYIGHTGTAACYEGYDQVRYANISYGGDQWQALCDKLTGIKGESLSNANCNNNVLKSQAKLDAAVKNICDKYGQDQLKQECGSYDKVQNPAASPDGVSCDNSDSPLTWIVCPVVEGFSSVIQGVDNLITQQLSVGSPDGTSDPNEIFCDTSTPSESRDACKAYKSAWASFRNLALGLIVIVGLIVVISQAMGTELLDAYTVRKMLPRIIIVSVAITLSWVLMQFFVQLSNDLGYGVRFLINQPFANAGIDQLKLDSGGSFAIGLIGGAALGFLGVFGLLSFALTGVLAVLVAFLVLVLRQIAIIIMVIIAPVAIVLYILPNTERYYKLWWESFAKALMMFPIIVAFITIGRVFAAVASQSGSALGQIIGFAAYFAPYFMIPLTFRMAGSTMGMLGNFVNERGRPLSEGLKQYRGRQRAEQTRKMQNYSRFSNSNPVGRGLNTAIGAAANPRNLRRGRAGVRAGRLTGQLNEGGAALEHDKTYQAHKGDDNFLLAVANRQMAQKKLAGAREDFQAASNGYNAARAQGDQEGMATHAAAMSSAQGEIAARTNALAQADQVSSRDSAGTRIKALNDLASTGFQFAPGDVGYQEMSDTVDDIARNDPNARATILNTAQYMARSQGGRPDLGGINHGAKSDVKMGIRKLGNYGRGQGKTDLYHGGAGAWLGNGAVGANGKSKSGPELQQGIIDSVKSGDTDYSSVAEWHSMLLRDKGSASDANKIEIDKQLQAIQAIASNPAQSSGSVQTAQLEDMAEAAAFKERIQQNLNEMRSDGIPDQERTENQN